MFKKGFVFFSLILVMGSLDWLTTTAGVLGFNAKETNPLLSPLTSSNLLLFSFVKLFAIVVAGFAFYKASSMSHAAGNGSGLMTRFLDSGFSISVMALTVVVANNVITLLRF